MRPCTSLAAFVIAAIVLQWLVANPFRLMNSPCGCSSRPSPMPEMLMTANV